MERVTVGTNQGTKVAKVADMGRKNPVAEGQWQEANGKRKVAREKPEHVGRVARQDTLQRVVEKEATTMKMTVKTLKKQLTIDNEDDRQAWCLLDEREDEQRQEVMSRRDKKKAKRANRASLLSVENSHNSNPK